MHPKSVADRRTDRRTDKRTDGRSGPTTRPAFAKATQVKICVPTLPKIFRPVTRYTLIFLFGLCINVSMKTIFGQVFMKFSPNCTAKELGMLFTTLGSFYLFLDWEGADIRPKIGL